MQRTARQLVEYGYLRIEKVDKQRTLLLGTGASDYLSKLFPGAADNHRLVVKDTYRKAPGINNAIRRRRNMRVSEAAVFMNESGMVVSPAQKPWIANQSVIPSDRAYYYTSKEMKSGMEWEERRASASRSCGFLVTPLAYYMVYCMNSKLLKIGESTERYTRDRIEGLLNQITAVAIEGTPRYMESAIILTTSYYTILCRLGMEKAENRRKGQDRIPVFEIDETFQNYYLLPYTREGSALLRMLVEPNGETTLRNLAIPVRERVEQIEVDCDGYSENKEYLFVFFIPNLKRLKRFLGYARRRSTEKFIIYAFPFQEEGLRQIKTRNVELVIFALWQVEALYEERKKKGVI